MGAGGGGWGEGGEWRGEGEEREKKTLGESAIEKRMTHVRHG